MSLEYEISNVISFLTSPEEIENGKLAYLACTMNGDLRLNGLTLRRTAAGNYTVSFPFRRDKRGKKRYYICPLNEKARREIEYQILAALNLEKPRKSA